METMEFNEDFDIEESVNYIIASTCTRKMAYFMFKIIVN